MKVNKIPEDIREYLRYEDGKLYWTKKPCKRVKAGSEAGHYSKSKGYKVIIFRGVQYRTHRVIWFLVKGEQPTTILDHINNNPTDNRIENLRPASMNQNQHNAKTRKDNTSGVKGVYWHKPNKRWIARVKINNKYIHIGNFTDLNEAEQAVKEARQQIHGEYANHG